MKNMRGRIFRKLKSISTPTWRPGLVFQANTPIQAFQTSNLGKERKNQGLPTLTGENFSISESPVDVKEEKLASGPNADSDGKFLPSMRSKEEGVHASESMPDEIGSVSMHDRVQSLGDFDPSLEIGSSIVEMESPPESVPLPSLKLGAMEDHINCEPVEDKDKLPLITDFEDRCPPGGRDSLVLYTTSLRGIRKTFEDCNTIRFLLESFRVVYSERDVSMHLEYREELWEILGGRVVPPRLFIRGRYIGGADEVVGLHEKGMLQNLLQGIPLTPSNYPCRGCAGMRFVLCFSCNGSRKVMPEGQNNEPSIRCPDCNENGLIKCSVCS
ncbi:hypothetical protein Pfo_004032 [Paulownia fortunei]|nr:hypothetical protein Pfo_004032 [Paulownia fortunei]